MSAERSPAAGVRQAALALHAMPPSDRAWVLDALPPRERQQLNALLEELQVLGIPADSALAADAAHGGVSCAREVDWLQELDARGATALEFVLRGEPTGVTSAVLGILREPARRQLTAALRDGTAFEARSPLPAALEQALRTALEPRWKAAARAPGQDSPSKWKLAKARIARLGRLP